MKPHAGGLRVCSVTITGRIEPTSHNSENFEAKGVHIKRAMLCFWTRNNSMPRAITRGEALAWRGSVIFMQDITLMLFTQQLPHKGENMAE